MSNWTDPRPMSPHLQVWKYHATMVASISHRFTGAALYFGTFLIGAWIVALASGEEAYGFVEAVMLSAPGKIVLFLWAAAAFYHLFNGIRHLVWDGPMAGFDPKVASTISIINFAAAVIVAALVWVGAVMLG